MPSAPTSAPATTTEPTLELSETQLISIVTPKLRYVPHKWQVDIGRALYSRKNRVVVSTAATGAGKSLTFWLSILAGETGITFIVVPLNVLGQQMSETAATLGIPAFNATRETLRQKDAFQVCPISLSNVTTGSLFIFGAAENHEW